MMGKPKSLEDIYEAIGGFGRFQLLAVSIILFPEWPAGMMDLLPVFTGGHPTTWLCTDETGTRDVTNDSRAMCSCNGTLDGGVETIVSEWQLVCGYEWVTDFLTSIQMVGMVTGDILGTYLSDRIGRKKALYLSCATLLLGNLASSVAANPYIYAMARLLVGTGVSAIIILSSVYPLELMTPKWRSLSGAAGPWGEGVMTLALLAYLCPPWRMLTVLTSIPMTLMFFTQSFLPESPRWLLLNGKVEKTKQVLRQIAHYNGTGPIKEELIENLEDLVRPESESAVAIKEFCRNPKFVVKTIIFMGCWFACNLIYYGIGFNVKNLSGDPYLNVFYMAIVETVGFRSAIFISRWFGRKNSFLMCTGATTILMLAIVVMDSGIMGSIEYSELRLTVLTFSGKMFIAASMAVIDCFTCESFPTVARSTGVGFANFAGSIGCIVAPQMAFLGSNYKTGPYFVFAAFALLCTGSTLFLKETNGKPIEENL